MVVLIVILVVAVIGLLAKNCEVSGCDRIGRFILLRKGGGRVCRLHYEEFR